MSSDINYAHECQPEQEHDRNCLDTRFEFASRRYSEGIENGAAPHLRNVYCTSRTSGYAPAK